MGPKPVQGMQTWGETAGRVTDLYLTQNVGWAATAGGGVWKQTANGWVPTTDQAQTLAIGGIAVQANNSQIVYAATGEPNHCGDCQLSQGVLKTTDNGSTWTLLGASTFATGHTQLGQIVIDRNNSSNLLVASSDGLYNSTDGGTTWTLNSSLNGLQAHAIRVDSIAQDPNTATTFWAGVSENCQGPGYLAESTNSGQTWTVAYTFANLNSGTYVARVGLGVGKDVNGTVIYMAPAACDSRNISNVNPPWNEGELIAIVKMEAGNFSAITNAPGLYDYFTLDGSVFQGTYDNAVAIDPGDSNHVVFGGTSILTTFDGGSTFYDIAFPYDGGSVHPDVHVISFYASNPTTNQRFPFMVGTDGGIWSSINGQADWVNQNANLDITQYYSGSALDSSNMIGGAQDEGIIGRMSGGPSLPIGQSLYSADGTSTAMDPTAGSTTIYGGLPYGDLIKGDSTDRTNWRFAGPCNAQGDPACNDYWDFVAPMLMDPGNSSELYTAGVHVWASPSGGIPPGPSGWVQASPDLTAGTTFNNGDHDVVTTMATGAAGVLATGSYYGKVFESTIATNQQNYTDLTSGLPTWTSANYVREPWIGGVAVNPADSSELWAGIGAVGVSRIWHRVGVSSWSALAETGLPNLPIVSLAVDPLLPTNVYVGTGAGVFVCTTCGGVTPVGNWAALGSGLPNVRVDALTFSHDQNVLIAWTHGRGAWMIGRGGSAAAGQPSATLTIASGTLAPTNGYTLGTMNTLATLQLSNAANATGNLNIRSIAATLDFYQSNNCPAALTPGSSCQITVSFDPAVAGQQLGAIMVADNSPGGFDFVGADASGAAQGWTSLGGISTHAPASSSNGITRMDAFIVGSDSALWHRRFNLSTWAAWESLGGLSKFDPVAVSRAGGIDLFIHGVDNALWWRRYDGTTWLPWQSLGGIVKGGPTVASWGPNRLDVFAQGSDNALWHRSYDGTNWGAWESLGGILNQNPGAVSWGYGRIDVFVRGGDFALWHRAYNFYGSGWQAWEGLGGKLNSAPAAASWGPGRLDVFVQGTDRAVWHRIYSFGWDNWFSEGGIISGNLSATARTVGLTDVFVVGQDSALWHRTTGP